MIFKLYTENEAEEYLQRFDQFLHKRAFETEEKKLEITDIWASRSGWNIEVNGIVQPGFYVAIALENGKILNPIEFAGVVGLKEDFSAKHIAINFGN